MTTTSVGGCGDVEGGKITEPVGGAGGPGLGRTVVAVVVEGRLGGGVGGPTTIPSTGGAGGPG